jgi:hypothetical protein
MGCWEGTECVLAIWPHRYTDLQTLGINANVLEFMPVLKASEEIDFDGPAQPREQARGLSIAETKRGLSITFGVPSEAIEITIRG